MFKARRAAASEIYYQGHIANGEPISDRQQEMHEYFLTIDPNKSAKLLAGMEVANRRVTAHPATDQLAQESVDVQYIYKTLNLQLANNKRDQKAYSRMLNNGWEVDQVVPRSLRNSSTVIFKRPK